MPGATRRGVASRRSTRRASTVENTLLDDEIRRRYVEHVFRAEMFEDLSAIRVIDLQPFAPVGRLLHGWYESTREQTDKGTDCLGAHQHRPGGVVRFRYPKIYSISPLS